MPWLVPKGQPRLLDDLAGPTGRVARQHDRHGRRVPRQRVVWAEALYAQQAAGPPNPSPQPVAAQAPVRAVDRGHVLLQVRAERRGRQEGRLGDVVRVAPGGGELVPPGHEVRVHERGLAPHGPLEQQREPADAVWTAHEEVVVLDGADVEFHHHEVYVGAGRMAHRDDEVAQREPARQPDDLLFRS